jgi:hypothetical protein
VELWPTTSCGVPDILINGQLVLYIYIELKIDPDKGGRHRGIGQCADYSREFVTSMTGEGSRNSYPYSHFVGPLIGGIVNGIAGKRQGRAHPSDGIRQRLAHRRILDSP